MHTHWPFVPGSDSDPSSADPENCTTAHLSADAASQLCVAAFWAEEQEIAALLRADDVIATQRERDEADWHADLLASGDIDNNGEWIQYDRYP